MLRDDELLTLDQILDRISQALHHKKPMSFVRIGDLENVVMAQDAVMSIEEVMNSWIGNERKQSINGITLPNLQLRDELITSIKKADLVGILAHNDDIIKAPNHFKRELTDKVFQHFNIAPKELFDMTISRQLHDNKKFWDILRKKRILIVTKMCKKFKETLEEQPFNQNVTLTYSFKHNDQIDDATNYIMTNKDNFDIALFACGVNAVILSQRIADMTGKVCFDFGNIKKMGFQL